MDLQLSQDISRQYTQLNERCCDLFNDLRDLPTFGRYAWQGYFDRVFTKYDELWKQVQTASIRQILEVSGVLKRDQIGFIASQIGQLYYFKYLRSADATHLKSALSFYEQVPRYMTRWNVSSALPEDEYNRMMRYFARMSVVCLLLGKLSLIDELILPQMDAHCKGRACVEKQSYQADDLRQFVAAVKLATFTRVPAIIKIAAVDGLQELAAKRACTNSRLRLREVVVVGACQKQLCLFNEFFSLDMYYAFREDTATVNQPHRYQLLCPRLSELLGALYSITLVITKPSRLSGDSCSEHGDRPWSLLAALHLWRRSSPSQ